MLENINSKVTIRAYKKSSESDQQGWSNKTLDTSLLDQDNVFKAMFNPETFAVGSEINYDEEGAEGEIGSDAKFKNISPTEVSFDFLIDGTGASGTLKDVKEEVEKFEKVVGFEGETHQPKFLSITWGKFHIRCRVKKYEVKYTLFRPDGAAARCVISATFGEYKTKTVKAKEANMGSPDLTHLRTIKANSKLSLMSYEIYNDPKYYLEIAKVNNLDNFRQLKTGERIQFPPIDKTV